MPQSPPLSETEARALEAALETRARQGRPVGYAALAAEIALGPPHRIHRLTLALEELVRRDHADGRPLLAALAVGKAGIPGRGYFQLLTELGRYEGPDQGPAAAAQHARDLQDAIAHWRSFRLVASSPAPPGEGKG